MENREFTIHGPGLTEANKQEVNEFISGFDVDAQEPVEGEVEKSPEIERMILEVNQYREEIAAELQLPKPKPIVSAQIHLLPPALFKKRYPEYSDEAWGNHENMGDGIFIKYDPQQQNADMIKMFLLHEGVHIDSFRAFFTSNDKGEAVDNLTGETRSGYWTSKPRKNAQEQKHQRFIALNEAVVQKTTWEKIQDKLPTVKTNPSYINEIKILDTIVTRIAEVKQEDESIVWNRIKKGLFTGEMMHLRDIAKIYGQDSLHILADLTTEDEQATKTALDYFTEYGNPYSNDYSSVPPEMARFIVPHAAEGPTTHKLSVTETNFEMPVSFHIEGKDFFITGMQEESNAGGIIWGVIAGDIVKIKHIELAKDFRGKGVGKALLADLEEQLKNNDVKTAYSEFYKNGTIEFFLKNGYQITSLDSLTQEQKTGLEIEDEDFDERVNSDNDFRALQSNPENKFKKILLVKKL